MRSPRWGDVRRFCERQGYEERKTTHYMYQKLLPDRTLSRTMVSFGADGESIRPGLWQDVWKVQLRLKSEADFWSGLEGGPVRHDIPPTPEASRPLPDYLVRFLRDVRHYSDEEIEEISREEAQDMWDRYHLRTIWDALPPESDGDPTGETT